MKVLTIAPLATVLILSASASSAGTLHVPGDYPTISQAVAAAEPGDAVAVGPGTWAEGATIDVTVPLTLFSTAGAEATVLDGEDAYRILRVSFGGRVSVSGFTFVRGLGIVLTPAAGALLVSRGADVAVEDCVFRDCTAEAAGAIYVSGSSMYPTRLLARRCRFEDNVSEVTGGAAYVVLGAEATFLDCAFVGNRTDVYAGAVQAHRATMSFDRCLFRGNRSPNVAGALYYGTASAGSVSRSTFYDHESPGVIAGTIVAGAGTEIAGNVFVGDASGAAVRWYTGVGSHRCNVYWSNAGGPMMGAALDASEIVADPLFCDAAGGNFHVAPESPCLPGSSGGCGLIGRFGEGCGQRVLSLERLSWGAVKAGYRGE